jgi:hypothetical protein
MEHTANTVTQELRRRIDSGEPLKVTREWFMKQDKVWNSYFADQDPFVQSFILDTMADFMIFLEQEENPNKPLTEIVLERVADLRQHHPELAKPTIDRLMKSIEPRPAPRSWAKGSFTVFADSGSGGVVECFSWAGTKQDAIDVQKRCLEICGTLDFRSIPPDTYAAQAASYLIAYGLPAAGDADRRPSGRSDQQWSAEEALCFRYAILRYALRQHASDAGQRIEDEFAGRRFEIRLKGDRAKNLEAMANAQHGGVEPSLGNVIKISELDAPCLLDPQDAVCIPYRDLLVLAGRQIDPTSDPAPQMQGSESIPETSSPETVPETVYVPRIPIDAAEAEAMLRMTATVAAKTYAGYASEELGAVVLIPQREGLPSSFG